MIEATNVIQTPAIPEPALAEVPLPTLPEIPAQPPAPELSQPDGAPHDEVALSARIIQMWQVHQDCQSTIKHETQQFRLLRSELGRLLHQIKALLAKPGRGGEWSAWLRERQIPRATADRLVLRHELSVNPDGNCLTAQFTEPTETEIQALFDKVAPKLRRVLRTKTSVYRFIELLVSSLTLDHQASEEAILILKPAQQTAVVEPLQEAQHEPVESPAEPVPVIADVLAGGNIESTVASQAM